MVAGHEIPPGFVDELLSLPARERRSEFLREAGLLDAEGLDRLLDVADGLLDDDPDKAGRLAELCGGLADAAAAPAAVPRAMYVRAGAHSIEGEFEEDLRLTQAAYDGYVALGMKLEALRTNVGKMAALLELGRYEETLEVGRAVLEALDGKGELEVAATGPQIDLMTALVQQNRGGCLEYMGRYDEALEAYALAEERYRKLDMTERLGDINTNRGAILALLGRGTEALAAHKAAAEIFEETDAVLRHAVSLHNIGETYLRLADYRQSLDAFEKVRRLYDSHGAPTYRYLLTLDMASNYLALNLYSEALAACREANRLLLKAGMAHDRARALWGMGSALVARSEFGEAERVLIEAATLFDEAGNAPLLSGVMLEQASLLAARGDQEAALATARRALDLVPQERWPVQHVYARIRIADLLLPDATGAEPHLRAARRLIEGLALPQLRFRLNERIGHLRRLQGRNEEARELLEAAIDDIESLRGTVTQDLMRASFLRDKTAAYEDLLQLYLARGGEENVWRAFTVAERAKSRALVDLISGISEKPSRRPGDPILEERLQTLQADLNATYDMLLGGTGASLPSLQARAVELEQEISRLRMQLFAASETRDPFADLSSLEDVREQIPRDATLLAYHTAGDEVMAFVVARGRLRAVRRLGSVTRVQRLSERLASQWDRFRVGVPFANRNMRLLERSAQRILSALYEELWEPVEALLEEMTGAPTSHDGPAPKLAIVPHGSLHQVPFQALFDGRRYLLERFEISCAPSVRVYALCHNRPARPLEEALVMSVSDPLAPAVTREASAVARHFSDAAVLNDRRATLSTLEAGAPGCGVLHLACHGLFRSDNPMFSALKLGDGWLMAADAMRLRLEGTLVTLSACESGRTEVVGGDETLGLIRAFLGAGAATLVVSLWVVQDETTAGLMDAWYGYLRGGMERAAALRAAQLEVMQRYPHPYFWAPFVLVGKR